MPTFKSEFQDLADELINDEFADFRRSCVFTKPGTYNPIDGTSGTATTDTVLCIREDYTASQIDGQSIQANDFKLLGVADDFSLNPRTDGIKVTFDGGTYSIISVELDAADAVYILQVRQ